MLDEDGEEEELDEITDQIRQIIQMRKRNGDNSTLQTESGDMTTKTLQWKDLHARELRSQIKNIKYNQDSHHVLILAFCFSSENVFKDYMYECGIVSIAGLKNERGQITNGR